MFEHKSEPLLSPHRFARRMAAAAAVSVALIAGSLAIGVVGYHSIEDLSWLDSLLEASMLLGGEGPIHAPTSDAGKVFGSFYALFAGIMFITTAGTLLAPVLHRIIHKLHLDEDANP